MTTRAMTTDARALASRRNGARSRGPKTAAGRVRAGRNDQLRLEPAGQRKLGAHRRLEGSEDGRVFIVEEYQGARTEAVL